MANFTDVGGLAKSYVHAQSLIGADKVLKPQATWKADQWGTFWDAAGRPKTENDYKFSETVIPKEALAKIPEAQLTEVKKFFHGQGLNNAQAESILKYYVEANVGQEHARGQEREQARIASETALKEKYGAQFDAKVELARAVSQKLGDQEFASYMESSGLGNDPRIIGFLVKVGEAMMDDSARGKGAGLIVTSASQAQLEISNLKQDKDFITTLTNVGAVGHKEAKERWVQLHQTAFPTAKVG